MGTNQGFPDPVELEPGQSNAELHWISEGKMIGFFPKIGLGSRINS